MPSHGRERRKRRSDRYCSEWGGCGCFLAEGAAGCRAELLPPNPSEEQQSYALSLDKTEQSEDGLGTAFAEQIIVQCAPQPAKGQP